MSITNNIAAYGALYAITACTPIFTTPRTKPPQRRASSMRARRKIRMASMEPPSPWKRICRITGPEMRAMDRAGGIGRIESFRILVTP